VATQSAEVVIVGGGAVGASTAWHLTQLGITDVVLLEREELGSGSTSKSAGGVRAQFADELNVRIALRSLAEFEMFGERFGVDIGFVRAGYLFLLDSAADAERFREALALQASLGVPSRELSVDEALEIVPGLDGEGLVAATFCPTDGYLTPEAVVGGWASAAREAGVRIRQGEPVTSIALQDGQIAAVETARARIATHTVVCAAGVWSREVAALASVELPVKGEPRSMHYTPESGGLPWPLPLTVDFGTGFYFHSEGTGLVFGGRERELEDVAEHAARRLPVLAELPVHSSWWGYYEMSPDHNAIVGELAGPARFLYATGFSGHGFQQAPAVGEHLAELVAGVEPTLDLSPFALDRFDLGAVREEHFVI
jgi:glycine/D-amino acid oxidase-like deaminating enzyme